MINVKKHYFLRAIFASALSFGLATSVGAATLQLDFDTSFGDPLDPDTGSPDGPAPWLTAFFDDGGTAGSVTLTLTVGTVGGASVTDVYLNVDDAIDISGFNMTNSSGPGNQASSSIDWMTDNYKAGNDGKFDILIGFGNNAFTAGETSTFDITADGLVASSFNIWSTPDPSEIDPSGPFLGAAKFQSTSGCETGLTGGECSDWVGAVPVPAAVWLFGSGLLGLIGVARRKARA